MTQKGKKGFSLTLGLVLAGVGIAFLWILVFSPVFHEPSVNSQHDPKEITLRDIEILSTKTERLQNNMTDMASLLSEMKKDLVGLRSQLAQLDQHQQAIVRDIERVTSQIATLSGEHSIIPIENDEADVSVLTQEENFARAEAQMKQQIDLLDGMLLAEKTDPIWANAAQLSIVTEFQSQEIAGFQLVDVECRTTLCRIELSADGSMSPEDSFRNLMHIGPWQGQSFARTDQEVGYTAVYLAREGYSLPMAGEF